MFARYSTQPNGEAHKKVAGKAEVKKDKKTGLSGQRVTKKPGEFSNLVHL